MGRHLPVEGERAKPQSVVDLDYDFEAFKRLYQPNYERNPDMQKGLMGLWESYSTIACVRFHETSLHFQWNLKGSKSTVRKNPLNSNTNKDMFLTTLEYKEYDTKSESMRNKLVQESGREVKIVVKWYEAPESRW